MTTQIFAMRPLRSNTLIFPDKYSDRNTIPAKETDKITKLFLKDNGSLKGKKKMKSFNIGIQLTYFDYKHTVRFLILA